ncbi:hypothetical protein D0463_02110 [Bacillus sp. V59.32b]|nr:hypothetical protein D0463_02110 [Bacillus sp. V59.32b]
MTAKVSLSAKQKLRPIKPVDIPRNDDFISGAYLTLLPFTGKVIKLLKIQKSIQLFYSSKKCRVVKEKCINRLENFSSHGLTL